MPAFHVQSAVQSCIVAESLESESGSATRTIASLEAQSQSRDLLNPSDAFFVDEERMFTIRQMERIRSDADRHAAKVVDDASVQLQPMETGARSAASGTASSRSARSAATDDSADALHAFGEARMAIGQERTRPLATC